MPIVGDGKDVRVIYNIPPEIKQRIKHTFLEAFMLDLDESVDYPTYFYLEGTCGWAKALHKAAGRSNHQWLADYFATKEGR